MKIITCVYIIPVIYQGRSGAGGGGGPGVPVTPTL